MITLNGRAYTLADFQRYGFISVWDAFWTDLAAELNGYLGSTLRDETAASAASAATSAQLAAASAGAAGTGPATGLVYGAQTRSIVTAGDMVATTIYDTRQDSDGGAWAGRPAGSWYWEALNTATRGGTRRFPAVAGLVLRAGSLTVYDLHDLDASGVPRMWRIWTGGEIPGGGATRISAFNGRIFIGFGAASAAPRLLTIDLANDRLEVWVSGSRRVYLGTVVSPGAYRTESGGLPADAVNGVRAAAYPGSPLDAVGLPIPTVLVATTAGASVIHPWGSVYDITYAGGYRSVSIGIGGRIELSAADAARIDFGPLPYADVTYTGWRAGTMGPATIPALLAPGSASRMVLSGSDAAGCADGVTLRAPDAANQASGMVAFVTTASNTGWMPGDIRGAWLCGTTTGTITASGEMVVNGDFAGGLTGWSQPYTTGTGSASVVSGALRIAGTSSSNRGSATQDIPTVPGQTYLLTVEVTAHTTPAFASGLWIGTTASPTTVLAAALPTAAGKASWQFVATVSTTRITVITSGSTAANQTDIDNVSMELALPDRSCKGRGLVVKGALNRTALPCGLAALGGFSASNYLMQPYNADLDFGTGDFWACCWVRMGAANNDTIMERGAYAGGYAGAGIRLNLLSDGSVTGSVTADGWSNLAVAYSPAGVVAVDSWQHVILLRRAGVLELWVDGQRLGVASGSLAEVSLTNTSAVTRIGVRLDGTVLADQTQIVMARAAAYAPTPAQIRKMYADERAVVIGGLPAILGGASNNITAMAANDAAGTLAVGTGDGISVFAGLGRVQYLDGASGGAAIANDAITAVSASGPHMLIGTAANAGLISDSVIARDAVAPRPAPQPADRMAVGGVTTDATAKLLTPMLRVGERETGVVRVTITARVYGAGATENGVWSLSARFSRDAGGSLAILTEADSQHAARWDSGTPGAEAWTDKTSGAMAVAIVTSGTEYLAAQVTGLGATRIEWEGTLSWERIARDQTYAA